MKKLLFLTLLVGALGCDQEESIPKRVNAQLVLLQVDYLTNQFEGGKIYNFDSLLAKDLRDSIPLRVLKDGGDYMTEVLRFIPTQDTIFFGTRLWLEVGERIIPTELDEPSSFAKETEGVALPPDLMFQNFPPKWFPGLEIPPIWTGINKLTLVKECLDENGKIGIYLYMRGQSGPPEIWDWYIMLLKSNELGQE